MCELNFVFVSWSFHSVCLSVWMSVGHSATYTAYHDWSITTKFGRQVYTCPRTRVSLFGSPISHILSVPEGKYATRILATANVTHRAIWLVYVCLSVCLSPSVISWCSNEMAEQIELLLCYNVHSNVQVISNSWSLKLPQNWCFRCGLDRKRWTRNARRRWRLTRGTQTFHRISSISLRSAETDISAVSMLDKLAGWYAYYQLT